MTRKLNIKLAVNHIASNDTVFHFLTSIKSISAYGLLVTLFTLFTLSVSTMPAQAELVDLSNFEPVTQISISNANWVVRPILRIESHCINTVSTGDKLTLLLDGSVDKQGKITRVQVKKSSGNQCLDENAIRQVRSGRMKPVMVKGKAVGASFSLPIIFTVP
ncbi:energy transducer TonB family protein [Psychrobacter immobilis]|uniref:energy transducer TonB family protein n=1 Tax=Psychrobacter immobilis TaxID=498 RepID=UPI0019194048|nr:energy transducer TonB [Psychrobacter immobilis]